MPVMHQSMLSNQGATILGSQPLYIQTAPVMQQQQQDNRQQQPQQRLQQQIHQLQQQQQIGILNNVQAVAPIKSSMRYLDPPHHHHH